MPLPGSKFVPTLTGSAITSVKNGEVSLGAPLVATPTATRTEIAVEGSPLKALGNLSAQLGGGQYSIGSTPQELIKSERTFDALTRARLRGGLTSKVAGVDHIIPLWAGGTNDTSNIQLLKTEDMDKKTAIDNLTYHLYKNNYINLAQSRLIEKNWNSNPLSSLSSEIIRKAINDPNIPETVQLENKTYALKDTLRNPPQVDRVNLAHELTGNLGTNVFKTLQKGLNVVEAGLGGLAYGLVSAFQGKNPVKEGVKYAKDVMAGKEGVFNQPVFEEGAKGILSAATGNLLKPGTEVYTTPFDQTAAKIARMGGEAVGTVLGFKALGRGIGLLTGAKVPEAISTMAKGIEKLGAKTGAITIAPILRETTIGKIITASPLIKGLLTNSGLFATYGQLSRQEENTLEARGKRLINDLATGALFGTLGYTIGAKLPAVKSGQTSLKNMTVGTLANAWAGYGIAKMEGANEEDALLNAGIFAALHGYGLYENRFAIKTQKAAEQSARNLFESFGTESKMRTPKEINTALEDMHSAINQEIKDDRMTPENGSWLLQRGLIAAKTLSYPMMPLSQRLTQEWKDINSVFERTARRQEQRQATTKPSAATATETAQIPVVEPQIPTSVVPNTAVQFLNRVREIKNDPALREQLARDAQTEITPEEIDPIATERIMSTGMGESVNTLANRNQRQLITRLNQSQIDPSIPVPEIWLVRRDLSDRPNIPDPTAVQIVEARPDGSARHLGWVPTEGNIRRYQNRADRPVDVPDLNPETNNLTLGEAMDDLGVNHVRANIEYARIAGAPSNQPYIVFKVPPENWSDAMVFERMAPSVSPQPTTFKTRREYFDAIPESFSKLPVMAKFEAWERHIAANDAKRFVNSLNEFGNLAELTPTLRDKLQDLTYGDIIDIYKAAKQRGTLNGLGDATFNEFANFFEEFKNIHGENSLEQFLNTKILTETPAPLTPVPEAVAETAVIPPAQTAPIPESRITTETTPSLKTTAVEPIETTPRANAILKETNRAADPQRIFINKTIAEGKQPVSELDYNNFGYGEGKTYAAFGKAVTNRVNDLIAKGESIDSPRMTDLYNLNKDITRKEMQKRAKSSASFEKFRDDYMERANKLDVRLIQTKDQNQRLKLVYTRLRESKPRKHVLTTNDGVEFKMRDLPNYDVVSPYRAQIELGRKNIGISDKDVFPVGFQAVTGQNKPLSVMPKTMGKNFDDQVGNIFKAMLKSRVLKVNGKEIHGKIFPVAVQNGIPGNTTGIFLSDSAQKTLIDRYNKSPKKYQAIPQFKENMERAIKEKQLPEGISLTTDNAKIYSVLTKDILETNLDAASLLKRINIFDSRAIQWNEDGKVRLVVIPDTTLQELAKIYPEAVADYAKLNPEKYASLLNNKIWGDGGNYIPLELITHIRETLGFPGENYNIKGSIAHKISDADGLFMEKSNSAVISEAMRELMRSRYNYETRPDEIYTFATNIKGGKNTEELKVLPGTNGLKTIEIPRRDFRFIFENPPVKQTGPADEIRVSMDDTDAVTSGVKPDATEEDSGTFSLSLLTQFSNKDTALVNGQPVLIDPYLEALFKPSVKKWINAWTDGQTGIKTPPEIVKEYYDLNSLGWGELKKMSDANATLGDLYKQFEKTMLNTLRDEVLRNRNLPSAYLKMIPDLGFLDPLEGKRRMLRAGTSPEDPGEVMISSELWKNLGRPEYLFTNRYPTLSKLAMSKTKILLAEDYGITNLGKNQVILNTWDAFLRKQGDYDGDGLTVFRVIPKERADALMAAGQELDGIPESIADHVEQARWQYIQETGGEFNPEMITVPDHTNPGQNKTLNLAGSESKYPEVPTTDETLLYFAKQMADAKQKIGGITVAKNLARILIDNGKIFEGLKPSYTPDIENATGALAQAAVDATSRKVFGQLRGEEGNAWAAIFGTTDPQKLRSISKQISDTYLNGLRPLRPSSSTSSITYDTIENLKKNAIDPFLSTVPQDPTKQHVLQKIWLNFKDVKGLDVNNKVNWDADTGAIKQIKTELHEPAMTPKAQEFIDEIKAIQNNKAEAWKAKDNDGFNYWRDPQRFYNLYYNNADQYSMADKKAISWFLLTEPEGNTWYNKAYKGPEVQFNLVRPFSLILPEYVGPYFAAKQEFIKNLAAPKNTPVISTKQETVIQPKPESQPVVKTSPIPQATQQNRPRTVATSFAELKNVLAKPQMQFPKVAEVITTKAGIKLAKEINPDGTYWLEQNKQKPSQWSNLAKKGHKIEHLILPTGGWAGKIRIDDVEYTYPEAKKKFNV